MNIAELAEQIAINRALDDTKLLEGESKDDPAVTSDEDNNSEIVEAYADLNEALDFISQLLTSMEHIVHLTRQNKVPSDQFRTKCNELMGEAQLFIEQWDWENNT